MAATAGVDREGAPLARGVAGPGAAIGIDVDVHAVVRLVAAGDVLLQQHLQPVWREHAAQPHQLPRLVHQQGLGPRHGGFHIRVLPGDRMRRLEDDGVVDHPAQRFGGHQRARTEGARHGQAEPLRLHSEGALVHQQARHAGRRRDAAAHRGQWGLQRQQRRQVRIGRGEHGQQRPVFGLQCHQHRLQSGGLAGEAGRMVEGDDVAGVAGRRLRLFGDHDHRHTLLAERTDKVQVGFRRALTGQHHSRRKRRSGAAGHGHESTLQSRGKQPSFYCN